MFWELLGIYELNRIARQLDAEQKAYERDLIRDEQELYDSCECDDLDCDCSDDLENN